MKEELKNILIDNGLAEYIEILEKQRLDSEELLSELNQSDFEKMGITFIGDQKKMVKLFSRPSENLPTITAIPYDNISEATPKNNTKINPPNVIIQNSTDSKGSGISAGISGVLGGIIGAVAVIVIILIIISNESWQL